MAKVTRTNTRQFYISIQIGLFLLIQIVQVYSNKLPRLHETTGNSLNNQIDSTELFSKLKKNTSYEISEMNKIKKFNTTKILNRIVRAGKQVITDDEEKNNRNEWKTFTSNDKMDLSTRRRYNKFGYTNEAPSRDMYNEGRVIFPNEGMSFLPHRTTNRPLCDGSVICDNIANYPIDIVTKQLAEKDYFKHLQIQDGIVGITNRIGIESDDSLCAATESVMYPKVALTRHGSYMYVVNAENFIQAVRVEICKNEGSPCKLIDEFASGYKTMCVQKYIYRQLLGIYENSTLGTEYFKIPSSCCCHVKFIGNTWERIGSGYQDHSQRFNDQKRMLQT